MSYSKTETRRALIPELLKKRMLQSIYVRSPESTDGNS